MYKWTDVAARTEKIYDCVMSCSRDDSLVGRLQHYLQGGSWFGKICCGIVAADAMYCSVLEWLWPAIGFEAEPDLPRASANCSIIAVSKKLGLGKT